MKKLFIILIAFVITSCQTRFDVPVEPFPGVVEDAGSDEDEIIIEINPYICSSGTKSSEQLYSFFISLNPAADSQKVLRLAHYYVQEAGDEGVNSDIAFVQMCLETGFLRFGGLVSEDMNNFCGLGAMSEAQRGLVFETEQLGVRSHIQHLHAYGCIGELHHALIDSRYKYVNPKGKAPTIYELAGTWASDKQYGQKLYDLLIRLSYF